MDIKIIYHYNLENKVRMSEDGNNMVKALAGVASFALVSVIGLGTIYVAQNKEASKVEAKAKEELRRQRIKYRQQYRRTSEYQRKKQIYEEKKRQYEESLQEYAYFDENDEMVIKKVTEAQQENLPQGYVKVDNGKVGAQFKVDKDMTGEAFISNLEEINK